MMLSAVTVGLSSCIVSQKQYAALETQLLNSKNDLAKAREELEKKTNANIMTYKKGEFNLDIPIKKHLCANLESANLSEKDMKTLKHFEEKFSKEKVSFVAYAKPLQMIDVIKKSPIYKLYKEKN